MKRTIALLLSVILTGCTVTRYRAVYDEQGVLREVTASQSTAMANKDTAALEAVLSDGANISVGRSTLTADPNSARAIGEAVGQGLNKALLDALE